MLPISDLGSFGEEIAARLLIKKGMRVLSRRFWTRLGEIDIVVLDHETLVFVEVKTRTSEDFGDPLHAVTKEKYEKMMRTCMLYCQKFPQGERALRIDIVSVILNFLTYHAKVAHYQNISPSFDK